MTSAARFDDACAARAIESEAHRQKGLQRIALSASCRAAIGFATADSAGVVEDIAYRLGRDARTVIGDSDRGGGGCHVYGQFRRDSRFLTGIEGIVEGFLEKHEGPLVG